MLLLLKSLDFIQLSCSDAVNFNIKIQPIPEICIWNVENIVEINRLLLQQTIVIIV